MSVILYIVGLLMGLSLFMYIVSAIQKGRDKISGQAVKPSSPQQPKINGRVTAGNVTYRGLPPRNPGERLCPLCASKLMQWEALYASRMDTDSGSRILIHGCRHCYKPDEKPDARRKSDY